MKSFLKVNFIIDSNVPFRTSAGLAEAMKRFFQISKRLRADVISSVGDTKPGGSTILSIAPENSRSMDLSSVELSFLLDTGSYSMKHQFFHDLGDFFDSLGVYATQISSGSQTPAFFLSRTIQYNQDRLPVMTQKEVGGVLPTKILHRLMEKEMTSKEKENWNVRRYEGILNELSGRL